MAAARAVDRARESSLLTSRGTRIDRRTARAEKSRRCYIRAAIVSLRSKVIRAKKKTARNQSGYALHSRGSHAHFGDLQAQTPDGHGEG